MERRDFIKISGAGALALGAAAVGCAPRKTALSADESAGEMVYRVNPVNGDKVSLLGFGCMRWPMVEKDGARVIDQEAVNEMVDYAIEHGIISNQIHQYHHSHQLEYRLICMSHHHKSKPYQLKTEW